MKTVRRGLLPWADRGEKSIVKNGWFVNGIAATV